MSYLSALSSEASAYLKECSEHLKDEDVLTLVRVFLTSKLADASRKKLDGVCSLANIGGSIPFSVQVKLPQFCEAFKKDLEAFNRHAESISIRIYNLFEMGWNDCQEGDDRKILSAIKAITSIRSLESVEDFPTETSISCMEKYNLIKLILS